MGASKAAMFWFTGFSGAGKTTLSLELKELLGRKGINAYILDGDILRQGICSDLGYTEADRKENIRRIGEIGWLLVDAGVVSIVSAISPYASDRDAVRQRFGNRNFYEIHVSTSIDVCESRDVKGLYKKARSGLIKGFTGIDAPYEVPVDPELSIDTGVTSLEDSARLLEELVNRTLLG